MRHFEDGKTYATIGSGLVVRWKWKGRYDFEINASREGVSFCGSAPILSGETMVEFRAVLAEATEVYAILAQDVGFLTRSNGRDKVKGMYEGATFP
jgi:hypothetical protein